MYMVVLHFDGITRRKLKPLVRYLRLWRMGWTAATARGPPAPWVFHMLTGEGQARMGPNPRGGRDGDLHPPPLLWPLSYEEGGAIPHLLGMGIPDPLPPSPSHASPGTATGAPSGRPSASPTTRSPSSPTASRPGPCPQ